MNKRIALIALLLVCAVAGTVAVLRMTKAPADTGAVLEEPKAAVEPDMTKAETITFDANVTTGYSWTGFVMGGDSVVLDSAEGTYVTDPAEADLDGAGGTTTYTLIPVRAGRSIVVFRYSRPWEGVAIDLRAVLAEADEQLNLTLTDVTAGGIYEGTVASVNKKERTAELQTGAEGEIIIAAFGEGMELPAKKEQVTIYTDGIMTMSLPGMVSVLAWEAVPGENAR